MTIIIRSASVADQSALGRLGALLVEAHHQFDADRFIAPTPRTEEGYGRFLVGQIGHEGAMVLAAAEERVGVVGYAYAALEGPDWMALRGTAGVIYDIIVDPDHRRRGIGQRLLNEALAALKALGAPRVVLSTAHQNATAQSLFAKAGFRPTMIEMTRETDA
ncbi:MAG TPA: GNAT family N-acetyltransferase [Caulobacteraceae bacterium]|jgi:ribosomal protein S18 acetylase RimI-like enzyme|nr:GNAT family N-acetyltransferase [Caulobacteraceae bacterium]